MVDVSIIIVNYNNYNLLENCFKSILKFTNKNTFEIIVVDNHSTNDDLNKIKNNFKNIILIENNSNKGFGAANNQGLSIAKGKYVLLLNNDTEFFEDSIHELIKYCDDSSEKVLVGCKLLNSDKTLQNSVVDFDNILNLFGEAFFLYKIFPKSKLLNKYHLNYVKLNKPTTVDFIAGAFMFCKLSDIKKINGFDERFYFFAEEADLCYRFSNILNGKVIYLPSTSIIHIHGATTLQNPWFKYSNQAKAKIQFYQKHFQSYNFIFILLVHYNVIITRVLVYFIIGLFSISKTLMQKSFYYFRLLFIYPKNLFKN